MVRDMAACPSTQNPASNTQTEGESDACSPVIPQAFQGDLTTYSYNSKGKCSVKAQAKLVPDCSKVKGEDGNELGLDAEPCHIT